MNFLAQVDFNKQELGFKLDCDYITTNKHENTDLIKINNNCYEIEN